jgi:hypothetical protein
MCIIICQIISDLNNIHFDERFFTFFKKIRSYDGGRGFKWKNIIVILDVEFVGCGSRMKYLINYNWWCPSCPVCPGFPGAFRKGNNIYRIEDPGHPGHSGHCLLLEDEKIV